MSAIFRLVDRDTAYLLPPSVDEWLPEDHLARFVVEIVDQLDISDLEGSYTGSGSEAYHPRMMLALLFYSYATGTFSSRKMEAATYESVPMRYVAANQHPDHDTICTFRRRFLEPLRDLFVQILLIAHQMGLVEVGDVAIDGSKARANASKHKAMSWKRACQLEEQLSEEVAEMMAHAEEADNESIDTAAIPEELALRQDRLEQIRQAKAMIEERAAQRYEQEKAAYEKKMADRQAKEKRTGKKTPGRPPAPPEPGPREGDQVNFTDSESRIMPTSNNGWQQAYNVQSSVDMNSYMILGGYVCQATNDKQQLEPALDDLQDLPDELGTLEKIAADSGYFSEENIQETADRTITPYIATGRQKHHPSWTERLAGPGPPPDEATPVEMMKWRLKTTEGRAFYARRKSTVEPVFGIIKRAMGFRQFLLRGLEKVTGEWNLVQCAYNLKRMHALA
ncbi:MAG: IS1182 family transposase [Bacteroidetes bacterium]|nr:IS1182 family transposase [Bacteroidota bacterium]